MRKIIVVGLFLVVSNWIWSEVFAQNPGKQEFDCSLIIEQMGYFWKLDSIGTNGFRLFASEKIIKARIDTVSRDFLISKFGNPNRVWKQLFGKGEILVYHTFDVSKMPKDYDAPLSCSYIGFLFLPDRKYLVSISEGDIDM